jgi:hypothetical protein
MCIKLTVSATFFEIDIDSSSTLSVIETFAPFETLVAPNNERAYQTVIPSKPSSGPSLAPLPRVVPPTVSRFSLTEDDRRNDSQGR